MGGSTGVAWSSSVRAVKRTVQSFNERNPRPDVSDCVCRRAAVLGGRRGRRTISKVDDVRSSWPLWDGLTAFCSGGANGKQRRKPEPNRKSRRGSDRGLQLTHVKVE